MLQRLCKLVSTMLLICLLAGCNVGGKVVLGDYPKQGVKVRLVNADNGDKSETLTDSNGEYSFGALNTGRYRVIVDPPTGFTRQLSRDVEKLSRLQVIGNIDFFATSETLTNTEYGQVIGRTEPNGSVAWYGIPYAAPPVNGLRWKAPSRAASWSSDTYLATDAAEPCVQGANESDIFEGNAKRQGDVVGSEDCLYLNIYAPDKKTLPVNGEGPLPVMFWIHGGSNTNGTAAIYNGSKLATKHQVVVVTVSYRLGLFGWLTHPALTSGNVLDDSGNYGTLDLIQALKWVQKNIGQFKGDPNNVTIFGSSAGAWNTTSLLISPLAEGLFHKAIAQSGSINTYDIDTMQNYVENGGYPISGKEVFNHLLMRKGLAATRGEAVQLQNQMESSEIADLLTNAALDDILNAGYEKGNPELLNQHYGITPVRSLSMIRDGVVFPKEAPIELFNSTDTYHSVPLMLGSTQDEFSLWLIRDKDFVFKIAGVPLAPKNRERYALYNEYKSNAWTISAVDTIATTITATAGHENVYAYLFGWDDIPKIPPVDLPFLLGSAHGFDVPFVFGDYQTLGLGLLQSVLFNKTNEPSRVMLSDSVMSYWAEFAHSGQPGKGRNSGEAVEWWPWDNSHHGMKKLILDIEKKGGIRMTTQSKSMDELLYDLSMDNRISNSVDQCKLFNAISYGDTKACDL